ncbi:MAG: hypothetical protein ACC653_04400 [Gammaproteobacteria bacterium]
MRILLPILTGLLLSFSLPGFATEEEDLAEMQKQLNAETMNKPFLAEQPDKVDAYIKEAMKKNLKPPEYEGTNWRRGYTCRDLLRYNWNEYRNCSYYYRYHGRYYPY